MIYTFTEKRSAYIIAFIAILSGVVIYALWRPDTIRFFLWLDTIGLRHPVDNIRMYIQPLHNRIPGWIVYSLPNGLWAFSYALIITLLWRDQNSVVKYLWFGSIPLLAIGYELLQYAGVIHGVFCITDLILSVAGISLGVFLGLTLTHKENKK
jgi:hypothetical protein